MWVSHSLTLSKLCLTVVLSSLLLFLPSPNKAQALARKDCDLPSTFPIAWLQNAKTALSAAGFNPSFTTNTAPAILVRTDAPALALYIGDAQAKFEIDSTYGLQYGARTVGTLGRAYRVIINESTGAINQALEIGNGFTAYPATQQGITCVQGTKNISGTVSGLEGTSMRFPCYDLANFGNAVNNCPPSTAGSTTPPPVDITERDQKLFAVSLTFFLIYLVTKPFIFRQHE